MSLTSQNREAVLPEDEIAQIDLKAILDWLATPICREPEDELSPLHAHLTALRETRTTAHQRHKILDLLYARIHGVVQSLLPGLKGVSLPLSRRTRQTVRGMQDLLQSVAEDYLTTFGELDEHLIKGLRRPQELTLWRAIDSLSSHLLVCNYSAAPPAPGVWQLLHHAYRLAIDTGLPDAAVRDTDTTPRSAYVQALLLACAQPASFTSREVDFAVEYISRFHTRARFLAPDDSGRDDAVFWVDLDRDTPPVATTRRPAPPDVLRLSCEALTGLAEEQLAALEAGSLPAQLDLPEYAGTPPGAGVLRRLAHYWGHAGKRRFSRRRQNYRAVLCIGLPALWQLFNDEVTQAGELTSWIVTNESPEGYALMHVHGKTNRVVPGDVVALRTENVADWQICIVRWALSENPEHLEVGLQMLATRATPAILACSSRAVGQSGVQQQVLLLPQLPPLHPVETIVAPIGTQRAGADRMVLMIEKENLELREIQPTHLDEQTNSIEVMAFELRLLS